MRRTIRRWGWLGLFAVLPVASSVRADDGPAASPKAAPEPEPDVFAQALADAHLTVDELGFRPRASWARYPQNPPYKMPFFDDLLAHPLDTYEFTRTLGNAVEDLLTPERFTVPPKEGPGSLFKLGVALGTDRSVGGVRGFGFGLYDPKPAPDAPLVDALSRLLVASGDARSVDPSALRERVAVVPAPLHLPLARLVVALIDARAWIDVGLRNVPRPLMEAVWKALPTLVTDTPDASRFVPEVADVAARMDFRSLYTGCLKALEAVQRARWEIGAVARPTEEVEASEEGEPPTRRVLDWPEFEFRLETAWGTVLFDNFAANNQSARDPFLVVRPQPRNNWTGPIGATGPNRPLSVALLLDADDRVGIDYGVLLRQGEPDVGSLASGIFGCGIVYSSGSGRSYWKAGRMGLGSGVFGMGVLVDEGGKDQYASLTGQGLGYFGIGLLLDAGGDDRYALEEGDGQGYGGPGGVGVLADRSGDDVYYAEPLPEKAGKDRADYHSDQKIVGSNAQGAGMGRRGDLSDGHDWAGGLGALLDVDGNDKYSAGNFSQGVGYWFGTGLLYDGGGDDTYDSVYFSHGSGAHFAIGAVVDEGGNDVHRLSDFPKVGLGPKAGAGIAFGWDVVNALVIDRAGNDRYEADIISGAVSDIRSFALLLDEGGDDIYVAREAAAAFGAVDEQPTYLVPHRTSPFAYYLPQAALFVDLGGTDQYLRVPGAGGDPVADGVAGDDRMWSREPMVGPGAGRNVVVARDAAHGRAGFLDAWPRRVAPKPAAPPPPPDARPPAPPVAEPAPAPKEK